MEHFPNPLDLFNAFTRLRAHGKHLQRGGDTLEVIGRALYLHMKTDQSDLLASRHAPQCSTELLPKSIRSRKKKPMLCTEKKSPVLFFFFLFSFFAIQHRLKCRHCSNHANPCSSSCWAFASHCSCFPPGLLLWFGSFASRSCTSRLFIGEGSRLVSWLVIECGPLIFQRVYWRLPRWTS